MYKKLLILSLIVLGLAIPTTVQAHPIDNTDSYFYIENEIDGYPIADNQVKMYSYINWFQASLLAEKEFDLFESDIIELLKYQDLYNQYARDNILVRNNEEECNIEIDESPVTEDQISLSLGTRIIGTFTCPSKIENLQIANTMFLTDFEFESNFTSLFYGETLLQAVTLDRSTQIYNFNVVELKEHPKGDQTVDNSQDKTAEEVSSNVSDDLKVVANARIPNNNSGPKKSGFFASISDAIFLKANYVKDRSFFVLIGLVFLLGFLHTIEAGHSKSILASSMLHNKMDVKKGLAYATIFTVTHLGDIIIVGVILLVADNYFNLLANFSMLEKFAGYALFLMALYLLLKNLQFFAKKWILKDKDIEVHDHVHIEANTDIKFRDQLVLGFLAGLAPCVFGWSIFMLILSTNKIWVLVPAILFFGLGIFVALAIVVFLMSHLRKGAYSRFERVAEFSPLISAIFLLIYASFLIF